MRIAVETILADTFPSFDPEQPDIEPGVAVGGETQGAGHMDQSNGSVGIQIIGHGVTRANLDPRTGRGDPTALPGRRIRPGTASAGTNEYTAIRCLYGKLCPQEAQTPIPSILIVVMRGPEHGVPRARRQSFWCILSALR